MKMLVSDYDQTFYLNDQNIKINIDMVKQFRKTGNKFVIDVLPKSIILFNDNDFVEKILK